MVFHVQLEPWLALELFAADGAAEGLAALVLGHVA